ncbi:GAF domain-containing protein [Pseudonocardia lacus]|uniref:GAF domain-containing protein n=1 Tax=Pseudonocardia lacus TaxID=2835865 RepID=UPI001BDC2B8F|nr:GAF domain-containing protein [Pseudonocardia lacus]
MAVDDTALASSLVALLVGADVPFATGAEGVRARLADVLSAAADVLGVDGVGLMMLGDDDELRVVGATDDAAAALETAQRRSQVGPGIDCVRFGRTVTVDDLSRAAEYAVVWQRVRDAPGRSSGSGAEVGAVISAPVRIRGDTVGTLNALHHAPWRWHASQVRAIEAYAAVIAILLRLEARSLSDGGPRAQPGPPEER